MPFLARPFAVENLLGWLDRCHDWLTTWPMWQKFYANVKKPSGAISLAFLKKIAWLLLNSTSIHRFISFLFLLLTNTCFLADTIFNPFSASQLSTPNFSLYNTYKIWHLVMRKWELIKQSQILKIKSQILSNLFNEKYGLRLGEFKNTTGTERVKVWERGRWGRKTASPQASQN